MSEEVETEEVVSEEIKDPKAVLAALEQAKKDAKRYREDAAALRAEKDSWSLNDKTNHYRDKAVKAEAKLALQAKGVKNADRVMKHLDLSDIDFDDDGNLAGFEGKLASLKEDLPELFSPKHQAGAIDQFANGRVEKQMTASEYQVAKLLGKL